MRRVIRNFIIAIFVLIVLFGTSIGLLVHFLKPDTFKHQISQTVLEHTGKQLNINGKITWAFFPWTGLRLQDISLADPKQPDQALIEVAEMDVKIDLHELFSAKIEISGIKLDHPILNLHRNKHGKTWLQTLPKRTPTPTNTPTKPTNQQAQSLTHLASLLDLDVREGEVNWYKDADQPPYRIQHLAIYASNIHLPRPFTLTSKFQFIQPHTPAFDVSASSLIHLQPDLYEFSNTHIGINIPENKKQFFKIAVTGNVLFKPLNQHLDLNDLTLNANSTRIQGHLHWDMQQPVARVQGKLEVLPANLNQMLTAFGIAPAFEKPDALSKFSGKVHFDANQHTMEFNLHLDKSKLEGSFDLPTEPHKPAKLTLGIDQLNLADYQLTKAKQPNKAAPNQPSKTKPTPQPTKQEITALQHWLSHQHLQGKFSLEKLNLNKLAINNLHTDFSLMQGMLALSPITASTYQGNIRGQLKLNLQHTPSMSLNLELANLQIEPFMTDLLGKPSAFSGKANLSTQLSSTGNSGDSLRRNINGRGQFSLQVRNLNGNDISAWLSTFTQLLSPIQDSSLKGFHQTQGRFSVNDSVLRCDNLSIDSPHTHIRGRGSVDLYYQTLDYMLEISNEVLNQRALTLPLKLSGPLNKPEVTLKLEKIPQQLIKNSVKKILRSPFELLGR